ncbi:tryptophan 2,3-dioxygenase family protein [Saccharothrix obliqua]|uniref:tryptophan 2,3-dioxygenase family protein n=1 Tax=Saccharothrix obliqua TaxID=2861747 RepID=UPI002150E34F|nr:tryptophan 2,3-dioxygenase family protein [Saccharothrix obliqua]
MTYARYLRLPDLLSLQHPLTPPDDHAARDAERLFIVVHQASEVLLGQALVDLRRVAADRPGAPGRDHRRERAVRFVDALTDHLRLLRKTLRREDFAAFRHRFGGASGMQSRQFHELFRLADRLDLPELRSAVRNWRTVHLSLVRHMIGDQPGSGDTSGVEYLARKLTPVPDGEPS